MNEPTNSTPEHVADDEHQKDERCPTCQGAGWLFKKSYPKPSEYKKWSEPSFKVAPEFLPVYRVICWHCGGRCTYAAALADKITGEAERRANNPTRL